MKTNFRRLVLAAFIKRAGFPCMVSIFAFTACVASALPVSQTVTLAQFAFENGPIKGSAGPGQSFPNPGFSADIEGTGMATAWHQTKCDYLDRVGNQTAFCFCSSNWSVGDYWQFECSSRDASSIHLGFDMVGSPTAPRYFQLLCSTDGSTFFNPYQGFHLSNLLHPGHWFRPSELYQYALLTNGNLGGPKPTWSSDFYHANTHYTADLSGCTALNNAEKIYFRLMDTSRVSISGRTVGCTGTARIDNFIASGTEQLSVPRVILPEPPRLIYGRALDYHQLDAHASIPGTFKYIPSAGSMPNAGTNVLTAIFTPSDTNYSSVTTTVPLVVAPAPLTVSAFNAARTVGAPNPIFTGTIFGLANGDKITARYESSVKDGDAPGDYRIVPTLVDPDRRLANYNVTTDEGTLTVSSGPVEEAVLAQWNFTSPLPPAPLPGGVWYSNIPASMGSGTAAGWHRRPALYWNRVNGTNYGFGATNWNVGDFWQFSASCAAAKDISVAWDQASSGAGPAICRFEAGRDESHFSTRELYMAQDNATDSMDNCDPPDSRNLHIVNLSDVSGLNGATNFLVRLVDGSEASAGGRRAGPVGVNSIFKLTIYGAVPLPSGTPVISWLPRPMAYGTPLGAGQLDATANTSGTFSYEPNAGTVLPAGSHTLPVVFVPSDSNYHAVTNTVGFMVAPRPILSLSDR